MMRGGAVGRGGGNVGGRGGGSGGSGGGRAGGNVGGKVKGGGKNVVRNSISTGGPAGGSRFLSVDRERELRENVLRRNSEASVVMEHSEEGGRQSEQEEMESEQGESEDNRNKGDDGTEVRGHGGGEEAVIRTGQDNIVTAGLNEFDMGQRMGEISDRIRTGVRNILNKIEAGGNDLEGVKQATKAGLTAMVEALEAVMSGISDGIKCDREARQEKERGIEIKVGLMEEDIRESKVKIEVMRQAKDRSIRKESSQVLTDKLRQAERQLKYLDIDFGRATNSRREIVERTISFMKEDVSLSERKRLDIVLRRTKFVILGKETKVREVEDQRIYTVPVMLEFRTEGDKVEVEEMLKTVGWFPVYHWPAEILEFIKEARAEVRAMGFPESGHYIKIRPEWREGRMELKAEVKENRMGGRYRTVAVWDIPPADKGLWTRDQAKPRKTFSSQGGY